MMDGNTVFSILDKIYRLGTKSSDTRTLDGIEPLDPKYSRFFKGGWATEEIKTRFLYLNAVLDQGSDMVGTREFLRRVTNELYSMGIDFLHHPEKFLSNTYVVEQVVLKVHDIVKAERARWAQEFLDNPDAYNLLLVFGERVTQVLSHIVVSWGLPLAIIQKATARYGSLLQMLDSYDTAEQMVAAIKSDRDFGLGKAIGDKACHLFCKWVVDEENLLPLVPGRAGWSKNSYEVPVDSNVGRVLVMSGIAAYFCGDDELRRQQVLQPKPDGRIYIRATNLRRCKVCKTAPLDEANSLASIRRLYASRLQTITLPKFLNVCVETIAAGLGEEPRIAHLDDGLLKVALTWCRNGDYRCKEGCALKDECWAFNEAPDAMAKYHT
ncbi:MAG: hypothetical protein IMF26_03980 [Candidatus Fermentithermobacillus carboniphilus]|uniref:Uncharacterized protein n=1 Tax=Candidatus Fermentithermobacillus carboniphilus TaxID=3085328 RepID=A0AAT9LDY0_9FIRM|nr:MAG: hypothetical protein IMF26_03980 [Candidatus Fermentithermobacillus carboniphilus]